MTCSRTLRHPPNPTLGLVLAGIGMVLAGCSSSAGQSPADSSLDGGSGDGSGSSSGGSSNGGSGSSGSGGGSNGSSSGGSSGGSSSSGSSGGSPGVDGGSSSGSHGIDGGSGSSSGGSSGSPTPFQALHTYYVSPTGNDSNSGTSPGAAWLSPNHAVDCGDVIVAAPGTYDSGNFGNTGNWGQVSNCPSTSGGIDGTGGIYFANLICGGDDIESCVVVGNGNTSLTFWVDQSNWAVTGFKSTNPTNNWGSCFAAEPSGTYSIHHVAFVNDWAEGCPGRRRRRRLLLRRHGLQHRLPRDGRNHRPRQRGRNLRVL
jgi:hypothetical protein